MLDFTVLKQLRVEAEEALAQSRLADALGVMNAMADRVDSLGRGFREKVEQLRYHYNLMLSFMETGGEDPSREEMYNFYKSQAYGLLDLMWERIQTEEGATCLARTRRIVERTGDSRKNLVQMIAALPRKMSAERLELNRRLFDALWTSGYWDSEAMNRWNELMGKDCCPEPWEMCLAVSAVTLSALHAFCPVKLKILCAMCSCKDVPVRVRAEVGVALIVAKYHDRLRLCPELEHTIGEADCPKKEFLAVQMQLFLTQETKNIERQLSQNIIPAIRDRVKNIKPDELMKLSDPEALAELGLNPEWYDAGKMPEIEKHLKQLARLQECGADIFMGPLSHLKKKLPFFNTAANWFLLFSPDHPDLQQTPYAQLMVQSFNATSLLCDNDRYTLMLLLSFLPQGQAQQMMEAFQSEMTTAGISPETLQNATEKMTFATALRHYLQNLYRFFRLFPLNEEGQNPFLLDLLLTRFPCFEPLIGDEESLQTLADFTFREKRYVNALLLYNELEERGVLTADNFRKAGYCLKEQGDVEAAAEAFEKADLLGDEPQAWTLKQLAHCFRKSGDYDKALEVYRRLETLWPDDMSSLFRLGECLLQKGNYDEAFEKLYKVDYLAPSPDVTRTLAWGALVAGRTEEACRIYQKLLAGTPTPNDFLNAGHAEWVAGHTAEAVKLYRRSVGDEGKDFAPTDFFAEDSEMLRQKGKSLSEQQRMLDLINRETMPSPSLAAQGE